MKKALKILKYSSLSIALMFGIVLGISTIIPKEHIEKITASITETYTAKAEDKKPEHEQIKLNGLTSLGNNLWKPETGEKSEVYCIKPGSAITMHTNPNYLTEANIDTLVSDNEETSQHGCADNVKYYKTYSDTYYRCVNDHITQDSVTRSGHDNSYDLAYIGSFVADSRNAEEKWSGLKQQAFWQSQLTDETLYGMYKKNSEYKDEGAVLLESARKYQVFYEDIMKTDDESGKTGVKAKSLTSNDEVCLTVDKEEKIARLGPFKIKYVSGYQWSGPMASASFGGISDMYLLDAENHKIPIKNIYIGKINKNNQSVTWQLSKMYEKGTTDANSYTYFSNYESTEGIDNANLIDWFAYEKAYPQPCEEFYVEFDFPEELVGGVKLHFDFEYLQCTTEICKREAGRYWVDQDHEDDDHCCCSDEDCSGSCCHSCVKTAKKSFSTDSQNGISVKGERKLIKESFELTVDGDLFNTSMKLGGFVFEDTVNGKETLANGKLDKSSDIMLKNIEVTLYQVDDRGNLTLAKLATLKQEKASAKNSEINNIADYSRRTNPTLTDENGYYEFRGMDPTKNYVVKFTYNGQTYTPTEYLEGASGSTAANVAGKGQYSSCTTNNIWNQTSKATEITSDRNSYDTKFGTIGSTPNNYVSSNSLGILSTRYNEVFTMYELAGIELQSNGKYKQVEESLIDTNLAVQDGKVIEKNGYKEGLISKAIRSYIEKNKKYPDLKRDIYSELAGRNTETWKKLQYIEDCKISAWTKNQSAITEKLFDQYPIINQFTTYVVSGNKYPNNSYSNGTYASGVSTYSNYIIGENGYASGELDLEGLNRDKQYYGHKVKSKGIILYKNVYEGQLFVNCGLWKRQKADMALQKDVYQATIKINGKTETYQYNKRAEKEDAYWEIQTRIENNENYNYYYGTTYDRALYPSDYKYTGNNKLEVYITYKIAIRNQSEGILTQIDEVVDYFDETYEFKEEYSWAMYDNVSIKPADYYNIMTKTAKGADETRFKDIKASQKSESGSVTQYDLGGYNKIYLNGLKAAKLESGANGYLYVTFKVNETGNKTFNKDLKDAATRHNIAEINGYTTWYANGTRLPNGITKNSRYYAGIVDYDSKPGNFKIQGVLRDGTYEYIFEDDTDRAKGIRVWVDNNLIRTISGTVWEDSRDTKVDGTDALIGNGKIDKNELKIKGIKVEMWEVLANGTLRKPTTTQLTTMKKDTMESEQNGSYKFEGFIPGNYIIRFTYGGKDVSATANGYNGQDYKSTTYQVGITQPEKTNLGNDSTYNGYTNPEGTDSKGVSQNETAGYGYSITEADKQTKNGKNYSDAKDIWSIRENVNKYSSNNYSGVTNELATTLADYKIANANTQMIAETGVIAVEGEYNRINSDNNTATNNKKEDDMNLNIIYTNGNDLNGTYNIQNVDFGLVERPKAQLELNKQVSNVKITLANQNVLFDASQTADNLIWQPKDEYNLTDEQKNNYYNTYNNYDKFRIGILERVQKIVKGQSGLIQPTMDKELTHGATIQITYDITVKNVGEVDYNETSFYYTGKVKNKNTIVTTSADLLVDYVENNLKYRDSENKTEWGWKATTTEQLTSNKLVNSDVQAELKNYNTILTTASLKKNLIPATSSEKANPNTYAKTQLILTQTITAQNDDDDLVYNNIAEILQISNTVGRRMAFSVQGNQKPSELPQEPDASKAEKVVILPPFGDTYLYYGLGIAIVVIISGAVIFIKKKVLKNK